MKQEIAFYNKEWVGVQPCSWSWVELGGATSLQTLPDLQMAFHQSFSSDIMALFQNDLLLNYCQVFNKDNFLS